MYIYNIQVRHTVYKGRMSNFLYCTLYVQMKCSISFIENKRQRPRYCSFYILSLLYPKILAFIIYINYVPTWSEKSWTCSNMRSSLLLFCLLKAFCKTVYSGLDPAWLLFNSFLPHYFIYFSNLIILMYNL